MSHRRNPWWASAAGAERVEDVDPVEAFRAARRPSTTDGGGDADAAAAAATRDHDPAAPPRDDHPPELCGVCPLCTLARTLEDTRPELLEHLTEAARHLAAAARSLVEQPAQPSPTAGEHRSRPPRAAARAPGDGVERIPLDDDEAGARPPAATDGTDQAGGRP